MYRLTNTVRISVLSAVALGESNLTAIDDSLRGSYLLAQAALLAV